MLWKVLFIFLILTQKCSCTIHELNDNEYSRMPAMFHLESYSACAQRGGRYCMAKLQLAPDLNSALYRTILEYSESPHHFNHTLLERGMCIPQSCPTAEKAVNMMDLTRALEGCLNETMWRDYGLNTSVEAVHCNDPVFGINALDVTVAVFLICLLSLNMIGSIYYDNDNTSKKIRKGGEFLSCFAVQRHWRELMMPRVAPRPGREGLQAIDGIRVISMICICLCHVSFMASNTSNTREYEQDHYIITQLSGLVLATQTFLVLSSFLAAEQASCALAADASPFQVLLGRLVKRVLRLTPLLAFSLLMTMTWSRFVGSGPLFQHFILDETAACWREWPMVLLYLNSYTPGATCKVETWYLSADLHLWVVISAVVALRPGRARALYALVTLGAAATAAATYIMDLNIWVIPTPDQERHFMVLDPNVNWSYLLMPTNLATAALGALSALAVRRGEPGAARYKRYRYLVWATGVALAVLMVANVGPHGAALSAPWRAFFAAAYKHGFAALVAALVAALALRVEDVYYGVLSWHGWVVPARLSYAAYVIHVPLFRVITGNLPTLLHYHFVTLVLIELVGLVMQLCGAVVAYLLLQAPIDSLVERYLLPRLRIGHPRSKTQ